MNQQSGLFDITMRAYDGAEVRKLGVTYMLSVISENYKKQISDFIVMMDHDCKELKWTGNKKKQKNIQKIFKEKKVDIVIQCNMRIANYLDVSLNLNNSNYKPYHKPYNEI